MIKKADTKKARAKRHTRVRGKISGTPERPRLNVFRSAKHIYAQIIDDVNGVTLASASSMDNELNETAEIPRARARSEHGCEACSRKGNRRGRIRQRRLSLSRKSKRAC